MRRILPKLFLFLLKSALLLEFSARFGTAVTAGYANFASKTTAMKLTDLLMRTAEANPQAATLHSIADKAEELVEKRYSGAEMLREMESFAHDTKAMRLIVDALRQLPYLPTLEQVDYKPYMALIACSSGKFLPIAI